MGLNFASYPGTLLASERPKTKRATILQDQVQLILETGSRSFNTGAVVDLTAWEHAQIAPANIGVGLLMTVVDI